MKYPSYDNGLAIGAIIGCVAGAAITIGVIAATTGLKRRQRTRLRTIPSADDGDGPSLMEELVSHNLNGF
jgi:hypothetical protein